PGSSARGPAHESQAVVEHEHSGVARRRDGAGGRRHDAPAESGAEARPDCREQFEVVLVERPIGAVTVRLDPAPAAETVAAGDSGDVADPGRTHHLVPARRAGEITARLGVVASGRVWAAVEEVLGRLVAPWVLVLERS